MVKKIKVVAVESSARPGRWHFATAGVLKPGLSRSLRTWASKRAALAAGKREHNV